MSSEAWKKENTKMVTFRVMNASGIPDALQKIDEKGLSKSGYIIAALREALIRDGYLQENQDSNQ